MGKPYAKGRMKLLGNWESLRSQLDDITKSDAKAEANFLFANKMGCLGIFFLFLGLPAIFFETGRIFYAIAIFLTVYGFRGMADNKVYDIENMRYQLPMDLLDKLAVDLDPKRDISLTIDFSSSQLPKFVYETEQVRRDSRTTTKKIHFRHTWLEFSAFTVDGQRIKFSLTRKGSQKEVPKHQIDRSKLRYRDIIKAKVLPAAKDKWTVGSLERPARQSLRSFAVKATPRGVMAKAVGPVYSAIVVPAQAAQVIEAGQVQALDILSVLIACFRGLAGVKSGNLTAVASV